MSLKENLEKAVENVKDAFKEGEHRGAAEGERAKREAAGEMMTPGEKLGSVVQEAGHDLAGDAHAARRDIRSAT